MSEVKKFKSPVCHSDYEFSVENNRIGIRVGISGEGDYMNMFLAPSDAPALCLAILEAAGVIPRVPAHTVFEFGTPEHLENIFLDLGRYVGVSEERAAAEADRVALEAEALKLCNEFYSESATSWKEARISAGQKESWLAVARAAREINKEAGQ